MTMIKSCKYRAQPYWNSKWFNFLLYLKMKEKQEMLSWPHMFSDVTYDLNKTIKKNVSA